MSKTRSSCHDAVGHYVRSGAPVVALIGRPNPGKSTLFNTLTGAGRAVGNYPGTTVEVSAGTWAARRSARSPATWPCPTCPGAYSLTPPSPDEALTSELLRDDEPVDAVVVVCDART